MIPRRPANHFTEDFFQVYDFSFRLRSNDRDARRLIVKLYQRFLKPSADETPVEVVVEIDRNGGFVWQLAEKGGTSPDLRGALWNLEAALCEAIIRSQRSRIAVHGVSVYSGECAAIIVGRSGAGKSTLGLALVRRGLAVASDDVTFVEPQTLHIQPMPRCFHLDRHSVALLEADGLRFPHAWERSNFIVPSDLRVPAVPAARAEFLIFMLGERVEYPRLAAVSQAEMVARLLSETGQGPLTDLETIGVLTQFAGGASCHTLIPGPLAETADALADLIRTGTHGKNARAQESSQRRVMIDRECPQHQLN